MSDNHNYTLHPIILNYISIFLNLSTLVSWGFSYSMHDFKYKNQAWDTKLNSLGEDKINGG